MTTTKETCPENCNRCSGEFCEQHGPNPCRCDVIERHKIITKETCPKCGSKYSDNGLVVIWFECGSRVIHENKRLTQSDRCRITELEKEVERLKSQLAGIANNIECGTCAEQIFTGASMAGRKHTCGKPDVEVIITQTDEASALLEKKG
jgi:hypothetical protein